MTNSEAFRKIAESYMRLAKTAANAKDRARLFEYASLYADLSEQSERREQGGALFMSRPAPSARSRS